MRIVERWLLGRLRHRRFTSLAEVNAAIAELMVRLNDQSVLRHVCRIRRQLFEEIDAPRLKPLPTEPYAIAEWSVRKVGLDYHVDVEGHFYSVPYRHARASVEVRLTLRTVEVFLKGERIAAHTRGSGDGKHTTITEHMPSSHRRYADWTIERIMREAKRIDPSAVMFCQLILEHRPHPEQGFRTCLGIVRLAKPFGPGRLEAAGLRALQVDAKSYGSVRSILDNRLDGQPVRRACEGEGQGLAILHPTSAARATTTEKTPLLTHPTLDQLHNLGLFGMAKAFNELAASDEAACLAHADWLALLLEREVVHRQDKRLGARLRHARLRHHAVPEDIDYRAPRGLARGLLAAMVKGGWIDAYDNLLITGPTGVGKSWLACALGHKACRDNRSVLYVRVPKLFDELALAHGDGSVDRRLKSNGAAQLLILDDWGLEPLGAQARHDLLEILEDRYGRRSTIVTSQLPVAEWHAVIGEATYADAILDRLVHNAHSLDLSGESLCRSARQSQA